VRARLEDGCEGTLIRPLRPSSHVAGAYVGTIRKDDGQVEVGQVARVFRGHEGETRKEKH